MIYLLLGIIILYGGYFINWLITRYNYTRKDENNMFIKELIWKIKEPYVKRKRAYYEQQWCEGKMSAKEMCERVAELYRAKPARKEETK